MKKGMSHVVMLTALLSASVAWAGSIQPERTGQTDCWNDAGTKIDCAGTGQDGELQMGASLTSQRFTDNGDGTIGDSVTGLIWLKNAHCSDTVGNVSVTYVGYPIDPNVFGFPWQNALAWSNALASGKCGLSDGSVAGDWRLPNRRELQSLITRQNAPTQALSGAGFSNVYTGAPYWTSSSAAAGPSGAWAISMVSGNSTFPGKASPDAVLPVRDRK